MPKNIQELRGKRAAKAKRGREATARFNLLGAKAERTAEEEAELVTLSSELDTLEAEVVTLDEEITAEEASAQSAARRNALFGAAAPSAVILASQGDVLTYGGAGRTINEPDPAMTGGFKSLAEFASCVVGARVGPLDPRLGATTNSYNANSGSSGEGFLVPPEYSKKIWDIAFETTDLLGMANPEPTGSNAVFKPKDETTPWGAVGVQAQWRSEAQQMQATKLAMTGEMLTLHELYAFCAASQEIIEDAPMLQDRLTRQAGNAISWRGSDAVMWGDGAGKPLGFMKAAALITIPKDPGQAAKTITVPNLGNMAACVLRTGGRPMWIVNQDILPQLITLVIPGTAVPAYLPNNAPSQANPYEGYLLGYPVLFTEHAQTLGTPGDIVCANMAGYYAAKKGDVNFATSIHLYFDQNLTAFRWTVRLTGQPFLSKPVNPANGATKKSHFVALAARA